MKRPLGWIRGLLVAVGLLVIAQYLALIGLAPRYVLMAIQRLAGGTISVRSARLSFPLTTSLTGLQLVQRVPKTALTLQRLTITPQWLSVSGRTMWVDQVDLDRPLLFLTRPPGRGFLWPALPLVVRRPSAVAGLTDLSAWRMHVDALQVSDGVIELADEQPAQPFHAVFDHLSLVAGPTMIPWEGPGRMSFAFRGRFIGDGGHAAPFYCSGWMDAARRDLQCACTLEPLTLAAFESYFRGPPDIQASNISLAFTTQWSALANDLRARIQLELHRLDDEPITVNGRPLHALKGLAGGLPTPLLGEITVAGPLDDPTHWRGTFLPGNEPAQRLIQHWLEHRVETVTLPLWGAAIPISLVPANSAAMTEIQATSRAIRDALEILTIPTPEESPAPPPISPPPPAAPTDPSPPSP